MEKKILRLFGVADFSLRFRSSRLQSAFGKVREIKE